VTSTLASATGAAFVDPVSGMPITKGQVEARERQRAEREQVIAAKEQGLASGTPSAGLTRNNFPPLLK